jgi:hypothetical protein
MIRWWRTEPTWYTQLTRRFCVSNSVTIQEDANDIKKSEHGSGVCHWGC